MAAFHGWLLVAQFTAGRFTEPWLVVRWISAAALAAALVALRRHGSSLWGRQGITIWVLAALLHGPAIAGSTAAFDTLALPESVGVSFLELTTAAAAAIALWNIARRLAPRRVRGLARLLLAAAFAVAPPLPRHQSLHFCPRPPPVRR